MNKSKLKGTLPNLLPVVLFLSFFPSKQIVGQCPTGTNPFIGDDVTISTDCTITGNLTVNSWSGAGNKHTLTIADGVTLTIGDSLKVLGGSTVVAAANAIINVGGSLYDRHVSGTVNTVSGGTYNVTENIVEDAAGDFTLDNVIIYATDFNGSGGSDIEINNGSEIYLSGDLNNTEDLTIDNAYVEVGGDFNATGGDIITIRNGGQLVVQNDINMDGAGIDINVQGGSSVDVSGNVVSNNFDNDINIDGSSGVAVGGSFTGTNTADVTAGGTGNATSCQTGGCCGNSATCGTLLPVSLINFYHQLTDNAVVLKWTTASELDNAFFDIELSNDGINFLHLVRIEGAGTTNESQSYRYDHSSYPSRSVYYRLSQTDFDGTHEVLGIILANTNLQTNKPLVYPNPVSSNGKLTVSTPHANGKWIILSMSGHTIKSGELLNNSEIDFELIKAGTYVLRFSTPDFTFQELFVVQDQ